MIPVLSVQQDHKVRRAIPERPVQLARRGQKGIRERLAQQDRPGRRAHEVQPALLAQQAPLVRKVQTESVLSKALI